MYIGPWQEYRLAKLQKHALEKIRAEGGAQICSQLATQQFASPACTVVSDEAGSSDASAKRLEVALDLEMQERIRVLMEPFMAKLPARLLGKGGKPSSVCSLDQNSSRSTPRKSKSSESTGSLEKGGEKKTMILRRQGSLPSTKQKKKRNSAAISAVDKRKRLYAKWIKPAESSKVDSNLKEKENNVKTTHHTTLPPLQIPIQPFVSTHTATSLSADVRLPQLVSCPSIQSCIQDKEANKAEQARQVKEPGIRSDLFDYLDQPVQDHEASVSEDEINAFLNWTDCLASPSQLDKEIALME